MKNFATLAFLCCFAAAIYGSVKMPEGYKDASRTFDVYVNKPRQEVEQNIKVILPNVQFKIYTEEEYLADPEETFFGMIRLVVNEKDIVVVPPKYFGVEPDLYFGNELIGKDHETAVGIVRQHIPDTKIVVQSKDGTIIWQSNNEKQDYILLQISPDDMKVAVLPTFVRVPK